jgi:hypothetical protein
MKRSFLPTILCIAFVLLVTPLHAQVVRGRLLEEGTRTPVAGGFVRLVNPAGVRVAEILSNASGGYQLTAPAGTYVLRVERLGYKTYETKPFTLDSTVVRDLTLPQEALQMPAITASAKGICSKAKDASPATAVLWDEVQKALDITSWTANKGEVLFQLQTVEQTLDPARETVLGESHEVRSGIMNGSPFAALKRDSLLNKGFVQFNRDSLPNYYGPDGELIMSDEFQQTHCFRAVANKKNAMWVGLAFEPRGDIKPSDVRGTLWIDRQSHELKQLEFSYDHLPYDVPLSTAGGVVNFARLTSGMWIVSGWSIKAPVMSNAFRTVILDQGRPTQTSERVTLQALHRTSEKALTAYVDDKLVYAAPDDSH